jgi:hypothetical protein
VVCGVRVLVALFCGLVCCCEDWRTGKGGAGEVQKSFSLTQSLNK